MTAIADLSMFFPTKLFLLAKQKEKKNASLDVCIFISKEKEDNFSFVEKLNLVEWVFWMLFSENLKVFVQGW